MTKFAILSIQDNTPLNPLLRGETYPFRFAEWCKKSPFERGLSEGLLQRGCVLSKNLFGLVLTKFPNKKRENPH